MQNLSNIVAKLGWEKNINWIYTLSTKLLNKTSVTLVFNEINKTKNLEIMKIIGNFKNEHDKN